MAAMNENAMAVVGIELVTAAQGCDFHGGMASSPVLEEVRKRVREKVPPLVEDRFLYPDLQAGLLLVKSGALLDAVAEVALPGVSTW